MKFNYFRRNYLLSCVSSFLPVCHSFFSFLCRKILTVFLIPFSHLSPIFMPDCVLSMSVSFHVVFEMLFYDKKEWFFDHCNSGGGAPRRTSSGRIDASLKLDPSIHFHGNEDRNEILSWLRYRSNSNVQKYRQELSTRNEKCHSNPSSLLSYSRSSVKRNRFHSYRIVFSSFSLRHRHTNTESLADEQEQRKRQLNLPYSSLSLASLVTTAPFCYSFSSSLVLLLLLH